MSAACVFAAAGAAMLGLAGAANASTATSPSRGHAAVVPAAGIVVSIVEDRTLECIGMPNSGTNAGLRAQEWGCNGTGAQKFTTVNLGNGFFVLVNQNSGLCLEGLGNFAAAPVAQEPCNSSKPGQQWQLIPVAGDPAHLWLANGFPVCARNWTRTRPCRAARSTWESVPTITGCLSVPGVAGLPNPCRDGSREGSRCDGWSEALPG
jgi:hypothetical protein